MFQIDGKLSRLHPRLTAKDTVFLNEKFSELGTWDAAFRALLDSKNISHAGI